ncbi:hypothetical protein [Spirosoma areae]
MTTNRFFSSVSTLLVLTTGLFGGASLSAQTYQGSTSLLASPRSLEASIYPVASRPSMMRVNFNNPTGSLVRVQIRDDHGLKVYEELSRQTAYRARFDLAAIPVGNYTVDLSTTDDRITQSFTIEAPIQGRLTMGSRPDRKLPDVRDTKGLIVSY